MKECIYRLLIIGIKGAQSSCDVCMGKVQHSGNRIGDGLLLVLHPILRFLAQSHLLEQKYMKYLVPCTL